MSVKSTAERTTITRDTKALDSHVDGNLFEAIVVLSKRSNQIGSAIKQELNEKLEEFTTSSDAIEEVFENREQIEISRHYERLPKPNAMAIKELEEDNIYFRHPSPEELIQIKADEEAARLERKNNFKKDFKGKDAVKDFDAVQAGEKKSVNAVKSVEKIGDKTPEEAAAEVTETPEAKADDAQSDAKSDVKSDVKS